MKLIVQATFEIDVTDWHKDAEESRATYYKNLKNDFYDYSVFMPHFEYSNLSNVKVKLTK